MSLDPCPPRHNLAAFQVGDLSEASLASLADHLHGCPRCQAEVASLDCLTDPVLSGLRAVAAPTESAEVTPADSRRLRALVERLGHLNPAAAATRPFDFLAAPLAPGEIGWLGAYRILALLGQGGMGLVFRAEDTHLRRPVALKVLKPGLAKEFEARQRFLHEARAMAALRDEHVTAIYAVGQHEDVPFLAMELLDGVSLEQWLEGGQRPTLAEMLRLTREVACGLAHAHERGLIHRDVKPANIWLAGPTAQVKLLDFGLARATTDDARLTHRGCVLGTPAYLAPEQARGAPGSVQSDLYSLGCVMYRLATGALPHSGADSLAVLAALLTTPVRPVLEVNPDLPPAVAQLIMRLLAREPGERPQSALAVIVAVQAIETTLAAAPAADAARTQALPELERPTRRAGMRWLVAAGLLAVAASVGTYAVLRPGETPGNPTQPDSSPATGAGIANDQEWRRALAALPPDGQVRAVGDRLKVLNPGFDGQVIGKHEGGVVTDLNFCTDHVTDLAPLRGLTGLLRLTCAGSAPGKGQLADLTPLQGLRLIFLHADANALTDLTPLRGMGLTYLECGHSRVRDLTPLRGMPLTVLSCRNSDVADLAPLRGLPLRNFNCSGTAVRDLTPLAGMPLHSLFISDTKVITLTPLQGLSLSTINLMRTPVTDLGPLRGMPLTAYDGPLDPARDNAVLRPMATLKAINGTPGAQFWMEVDAKAAKD